MEHRFITKNFICENCDHRFKKLVSHDVVNTSCDSCQVGIAHALEDSEFNRENMDRTYRLSFTDGENNVASEYHPVTDIMDRDPQNIFGDARRRYHPRRRSYRTQPQSPEHREPPTTRYTQPAQQQEAYRQPNRDQGSSRTFTPPLRNFSTAQQPQQERRQPRNIDLFFLPFTVSPFHGSVYRNIDQPFRNLDTMFSDIFTMPSTDFFMDNFSSNFTSNFINPFSRIVFIQSMQNSQPQGTPPASREVIKNLKRFKMSEEYCKKDENNKLEYPTCSICLTELAKGDDTVLIPCGHLFHDRCIVKWLEMHNTCPVCRYDLPTDNMQNNSRREQTRNFNQNFMNQSSMNGVN